jgi:hypothetical protein
MKKFKTTDTWLSMVLIFGSVVYALCIRDERFIYGYFAVGAWQVASMLVHAFNHWFTEKAGRRLLYHRFVAFLFAVALVGWVYADVLFGLLLVLLFIAPVMALYYNWICYQEVYVKMKRPMALLK